MSFKKEAKYILENAMLYDSNAFLLSSKSDNIDPMQNRSRISALKREADLAGIKLLDNVEISKSNSLSYKQEKILEIQGKYRKGKSQIKDKNKEQNNNKPKFSIRNLNDKSKEVNNNQKNKQTIKRNPIKSI